MSLRNFALLAALVVFAPFALSQEPPAAPTPPPKDPVEGVWLGTVTTPEGAAVDIGLEFKRAKGGFGVAVYLPEMSSYGQLGAFAELKDGAYDFPGLPGVARIEGERLVGSVGFIKMPFALTRAEKFPRTAAKQVPADWPKGPAPLWTHSLGAEVWGSPVAHADMIYVASADGMLHAVRASDGVDVWTWKSPAPLFGTPAVTDDAVFIVSERHELFKIERATGARLWSVVLDAERHSAEKAPEDATFIRRVPIPVVRDGVVYVGSGDKKFRALRASDGGELWQFAMEGKNYSPALVTDERVYVGDFRGQLYSLDRHTGAQTWRAATLRAIATAPVIVGDALIVGSRDYVCYAFDVVTGAPRWSKQFWLSWVESTPAVRDGTIYVGASDYARVQALDGATGALKWKTEVFGPTLGTPALHGDTLYVATMGAQFKDVRIHDGGIVALDRKTGAVKWRNESLPLPSGPRFGYAGTLALLPDRFVAAGFDGVLAAYPLEPAQ